MHVYQITYSLDRQIHTFSLFAENEAEAEAMLQREHAGAVAIALVEVA